MGLLTFLRKGQSSVTGTGGVCSMSLVFLSGENGHVFASWMDRVDGWGTGGLLLWLLLEETPCLDTGVQSTWKGWMQLVV